MRLRQIVGRLPRQPLLKNDIIEYRLLASSMSSCAATTKQKHANQTSGNPSISLRMIDRLPASWKPYMLLARADKPIGTALLYIPCTWSILMATWAAQNTTTASASLDALSPLLDTGKMLVLFGIGSLIMRGAGCTINDMWDRDYDGRVERTRDRPLASGLLNFRQSLKFLAVQLSAGLGILTQLNQYSILLGASSLALVATYPLAKRFTDYPQAVLGLTFNWGALLGWTAISGSLPIDSMELLSVPLSLYAGGVCWTLFYDTIYAHQDKLDDARIGVRSTALRFGSGSKRYLAGFAGGAASFWTIAGYLNGQGWLYYGGLMLATTHMAHSLYAVDLNNPAACGQTFRRSQIAGWLLSGGILADIALTFY